MNPVRWLRDEFSEEVLDVRLHLGQETVLLRRDKIVDVLGSLKEEPRLRFECLTDLAGVDHLELPEVTERFGVVYHLANLDAGRWLRIKAMVPEEEPEIDSVSGLWSAALWLEREVFDLFGLRFLGHPDLRRILTPDDFPGHPLRKDYPIKGRGYRERFRKIAPEPDEDGIPRDGAGW